MNDIEKTRRFLNSPVQRRLLPIACVAAYAIGLALMLAGHFDKGLVLWFISTVAGALTLYARRKQEKKLADLLQEEKEAAEEKH